MDTSAVCSFLKKDAELFRDISIERLQSLVQRSLQKSFETNEVLMHQGEAATHLGIVLSGEIEASAVGEGAKRKSLGLLKPGDTFNEMGLMTGDRVIAEFIAQSFSEVLLVPVSLFQSIIVAEPAAAQRVSRTIVERMKAVMAEPDVAAAALRRSDDPYGLNLKAERPEKILIINCGSSSLKFSFYDTDDDSRQASGLVERIGAEGTKLKYKGPQGEMTRDLPRGDIEAAVQVAIKTLTSKNGGVFANANEVTVIAHRVVHGGEKFTQGTLITDEVLAEIEALSPLAPLHNPVNIAGIRAMRKLFPAVPQVAVFDTAFHHTLPPHAYLYGLPYEYYETQRIRRYGFHGMSHHYVSLRAPQLLKRRPNELRLVSCHLGNGSSICAADHGRSVDTSMGFTPVEGLIMGTRSGDIDPGILAFLERTENLSANQTEQILNKQSGLLGLSGVSNDMREVLKAADAGQPRAILAFKAYCYRIRKYIGAYIAAMGGVDAVVFTGGIGEGSAEVRALALQGLECMGVSLDNEQNCNPQGSREARHISTPDSKVAVLVVPADEERMIAREALDTLNRSFVSDALEDQQ